MKLRLILAALALAACTPAPQPQPNPEAAKQVGEAQPLPNTLPRPSETTPRYVGRWAVAQDDCGDPPWVFEADRLTTQGEVGCSFDNVANTPTGYTIAATCHSEGDTSQHTLEISFAESARAMLLTGGPWMGDSRGLVYCGPL
ncbi:hypothetical protein [Terricaulis sp.]|uniref:hypothetical protein n=1 Tax=Terricaulis sp. TaxID=2768686 RepID=UPI003784BF59